MPLAIGTLLCNVPSPDFIFIRTAGTPFGVVVPDECDLVGLAVTSQGGSLGGALGIQLTNALDLVVGNL